MSVTAVLTPNVYTNIHVINERDVVWASPVDNYEAGVEVAEKDVGLTRGLYIILIGATGSGKSRFIEALASKSTREPLGISKDQLESVTQRPCIYAIKNIERGGDKIYIVDTPGFADPRISELQVLDKITCWRDRGQDSGFARILYFHPISDIRMPATRKRCLDMVKNFWGVGHSERAMLVTSMWDRVPERSREAAETRFTQLSTTQWGGWITEGTPPCKFQNTYESAMDILNTACEGNRRFPPENLHVKGLGMEGTSGNPVYEALCDRIVSLEQQKVMLIEDLARPANQGQTELLSILTRDLTNAELLLQKFQTDLNNLLSQQTTANATARSNSPSTSPAPLWTHPVSDSESSSESSAQSVRSLRESPPAPPGRLHAEEVGHRSNPSLSHELTAREERLTLRQRFNQWMRKKMKKLRSSGRRG